MNDSMNDYELLYLIHQQDEEAKSFLYQKYRSILVHFAKKSYASCKCINGISYDDFYQEACYGFEKAILHFDDEKNILFYTYVVSCIKNQLSLYKRTITRKKDYPLNYAISIQEPLENGLYYEDIIPSFEKQPYEICENNDFEQKIRDFQNTLCFQDACIFELRYNGFKYREISELLDISMHKVSHALEKLKKKKPSIF